MTPYDVITILERSFQATSVVRVRAYADEANESG